MKVDSLTVTIGGKTILDSVSFAADNEVLGVAGPNGSGKSTLLRTIEAAAWRPRQGIDLGADGGTRPPTVGYLPQKFTLPPELAVRSFVEYAAWIKNVPDVSAQVAKAIEAARLERFSDDKLGRVSGGVAQRSGFASVLVNDPDILLLDEPTTGVDMQQRDTMRAIIAAQSTGRVTLLSSHITEDLEQLCQRVLVLNQGRVRFLGTIDEARELTNTADFSAALLALSGEAS